MRVLMLSWRGPRHPRAGGAEVYTQRVLAGLVRRGHEVGWLCEHPVPATLDGIRLIPGGGGPRVYAGGWRHLRTHPGAFDVVVDQINTLGFLTPLYSPVPVVALVHQCAGDVWRHDGRGPARLLGPVLEDLMLRAYRRIPFVTVSRSTLADLRARGWSGPASIAHNGLDVAAPCPGPSGAGKAPVPTLVFLARLQARAKRLDHALRVHALVRAHIPETRLWVIGRGRPPERAPTGVTFFPDVSDRRRDELLAQSWLLIATSVREGWGRMVLEAAATGTTCAVYAAPGLAESAAAVGGCTSAPSPEALAAAVVPLLRTPDRLTGMGRQARMLASRFTWDDALEVWEAALAAVCPSKGGVVPRRHAAEPSRHE